ncbi:MAG: hypothetical protein RBR71_00710 [Gudongella sp.]|nr:hypothetical protein [Gudongella sp.]
MKQKGFVLIDIIIGFALIGLLASVVFPSISATKIQICKAEKKATVIDQAQRIVQTLKHPSVINNDLLDALTEGSSIDYDDNLLSDNLKATIYIDSISENYQIYSVEVKFLEEDISAKFQASRNEK